MDLPSRKVSKYGTEKDFVAFDIRIDGKFQDTYVTEQLMQEFGIPYVPVLAKVDSLTEALEYNNLFVSKLGRLNGIDHEDNITEGFIIKPAVVSYIGDTRVILKSKNERWQEKSRAPKKPRVMRDQDPLVPVIEQYVNSNRADAVISKMGEITVKDFGQLIKAMGEDVIEDMIKDGDAPVDWRHDDEYKRLGVVVNKVVVPFLKREILPKL